MEVVLLLLSVLLIVACGAFVAAEFSFVTINRAAVDSAAAAGDRRAANVLTALRSLSTQLSGAQLGITVTNLAIGFLAQPALGELLDGPLRVMGLSGGAAVSVSVTLALVIATVLTMVFGELVPKNLAIARPVATAKAVQGFQRGFTKATAYVIRFCNGTANRILHWLGFEPQEELVSARSAEELSGLARRSADHGTLAMDTAALIQRTLAFTDRHARDVMTPRVRMTTVEADASLEDLVRIAQATGHSRFPVVHEQVDDVVGVVHVRTALGTAFQRRQAIRIHEVMTEPTSVPDTMDLENLLDTLRDGGLQLGVVINEFGGVAGLVTLEDLVEELIGEIVDEHDAEPAGIEQEGENSWLLSGLLRPDQAETVLGMPIPEGDGYDTLGGLVYAELGRLAEPGDVVVLDPDRPAADPRRVHLTVTHLDGHRVARMRARVEHVPVQDDRAHQTNTDTDTAGSTRNTASAGGRRDE